MIHVGCKYGFRCHRSRKNKLWIVMSKGWCYTIGGTGDTGHGGIAADIVVVIIVIIIIMITRLYTVVVVRRRPGSRGFVVGTSMYLTTRCHHLALVFSFIFFSQKFLDPGTINTTRWKEVLKYGREEPTEEERLRFYRSSILTKSRLFNNRVNRVSQEFTKVAALYYCHMGDGSWWWWAK